MAARRSLVLVVLVVVAGLVVGSLLGFDLRLVSFTIGFAVKVNLVGVMGIVVSVLLLRRLG